MKHYVGIDLGTTNSAICVYDGTETKIYKSPEQTDVTPSAIYVDKRGHRFYGSKALSLAAGNQDNSATLFKRYMGTNKVFRLGSESEGEGQSPVECSAELLRYLYSYLPEEIREDPETVTVITVPAAFNQMKKDATLEAAHLAGIGEAALIQEPVAAVMSILKKDRAEKRFLVYDLGGGTFDISVAEYKGGQVSLLAQGGREMCGGRDWDLWIYENKIRPWLMAHFALSDDFDQEKTYEGFRRKAILAAEQAKKELSMSESAFIQMDEDECGCTDLQGSELYLDVLLDRKDLSDLVSETAEVTSTVTKGVMEQAGVQAADISQIIFTGGPTMYRPLRDLVCEKLQIPSGTEINPMTAVAEGAAIYAESIDWDSVLHKRKSSYQKQNLSDAVRLHYESRTAGEEGQIAFLSGNQNEYTARVWSVPDHDGTEDPNVEQPVLSHAEPAFSKTVTFRGNTVIRVPLGEPGAYRFGIAVSDTSGSAISLAQDTVTITRTLASVQSIPASHSIALKALDKASGNPVPVYLIRQNDPLPFEGEIVILAGQRLLSGSDEALVFTLWEGEIEDPIEDNLYIGTCRIPGTAIPSGIVSTGDEIRCHYSVNESGNLHLGVEIPSVSLKTEKENFYSRSEGQTDVLDTVSLLKEANTLLQRSGEFSETFTDIGLYRLRKTLLNIRRTAQKSEDPEQIQAAYNDLQEVKREMARIRKRHLRDVRRLDLEKACLNFRSWEERATVAEKARFKTLKETAELTISENSPDFETIISEIHSLTSNVMWRSDLLVEQIFYSQIARPSDFSDPKRFESLKAKGLSDIKKGSFQDLRIVVNELFRLEKSSGSRSARTDAEKMLEEVNVIKR